MREVILEPPGKADTKEEERVGGNIPKDVKEEEKASNEEKMRMGDIKEEENSDVQVPPAEKKREKEIDKVEEKKEAEEQNFALLPPKKADGKAIFHTK